MRIPTWRVVLTGGAIVILLGAGIGFVAASSIASTGSPAAHAAPSGDPNASAAPGDEKAGGAHALKRLGAFLGGRDGRLGLGRRLVHVTATVLDKDGNLIQLQLDHGKIQAIGDGSLTVSEAGGATVTVSTDTATVVRSGREKGVLADLKVGDEVFVQSRIDGGTTLAKHVFKVPATTGS
jgi:hypothetical protein